MTTNEKIAALRAAAKAAGADGVLIMTSDPHCSEYLPGYYNALPWFSGFIGENSTLVVTQDRSALWCDGRFYVQADKQLAGSEIECMHAGSAGVPTVAEYLGSHFADGQTLLLDGSCVPATIAKEYIDALAKKGASLKSQDVASPIWDATGERPALPDTPCELLTPAQTGATAADRIAMVRAELQKAGATALAVTGLDCVGWLLNLRARDLPCTPLAVAYALVTMDACTLFIAPGRLSDADAATLAESGVTLRGYEEMIDAVHALPADEVFLVDEKATNYALYEALTAHKTVAGADPIFALKGIKNEVELKNIRECHIRDGVAVVRFQMDLEKALARSADESLLQAIGLSLSAPAYTPNAIMTYKDQKSRERQMRITFLSIGLTTVVLMLLLAFCGKLYMGYLDEKAHKAELESRIASWPVLYTPDQLRNNLADTQKWQVQARTLAKRRIAAALMTELSTITPEAIHITGMRVTFKDVNPGKQEARRGTKKPSEPEESAVAVLTGSVAGDMLQRESQLAEFLSQLEHSPMVLSLVVEKQQTDTEILSFVATLRLV